MFQSFTGCVRSSADGSGASLDHASALAVPADRAGGPPPGRRAVACSPGGVSLALHQRVERLGRLAGQLGGDIDEHAVFDHFQLGDDQAEAESCSRSRRAWPAGRQTPRGAWKSRSGSCRRWCSRALPCCRDPACRSCSAGNLGFGGGAFSVTVCVRSFASRKIFSNVSTLSSLGVAASVVVTGCCVASCATSIDETMACFLFFGLFVADPEDPFSLSAAVRLSCVRSGSFLQHLAASCRTA